MKTLHFYADEESGKAELLIFEIVGTKGKVVVDEKINFDFNKKRKR